MAEEKIVLTLNEEVEEEKKVEMPEIPQNSYSEEDILTEEQKKQVDEFVKQIDLTQSNVVLQYGSAAQRKIANFSDNTLQSVKTKDLGETGEMLSDLIVELKGFDAIETEQKGIAAFFKKQSNKASALKSKYDAVEKNVDLFITGEIKHDIYWKTYEAGLSVLAGGHYRTETFGVKALMKMTESMEVECMFIEEDTGL